jgi:hypothetical protein
MFVVCLIVAAFVFWSHRANIGRLRRGEEHRFGKRDVRQKPTVLLAIGAVVVIAMLVASRFA